MSLGKLLKGKKMTIVLGSWCGDSKFQVPNFLKIMDAVKFDGDKLSFIAVDGKNMQKMV
jgi:thiol-disulfide isomerase/thioredoxin